MRGVVYLAAQERLKKGGEVIATSVGNPQALGQIPLTFLRQVTVSFELLKKLPCHQHHPLPRTGELTLIMRPYITFPTCTNPHHL